MSRLERLSRLARMPWRKHLLVLEALLLLAIASLAVALFPFRRVVRFGSGTGLAVREDLAITGQCRWAVNAWADRLPWRAVCFQRGLALHLMLRRRGIASVLRYGVAKDSEKGLHAHVWVDVGARTVMGGEQAPNYRLVASFPAGRD